MFADTSEADFQLIQTFFVGYTITPNHEAN